MQIALNPIEPLVERDAMDLADQFILPVRNELGDHGAENKQRRHRFDDRERPCKPNRQDVAVTYRSRRDETEVKRGDQSTYARSDRRAALQQSVLAEQRAEPVAETA